MAKASAKVGVLDGDPEQVLVRDNKKRVHHLLQLHDAASARRMRRWPSKLNGLVTTPMVRMPKLTRCLSNNGSRAGSSTAAHAGGHKHHMRAGQMFPDRVDCLFGCGAPQFGLRAGAETLGHTSAHLDDALGLGLGERLRISVSDDEFDALQACRDHVVDSITAGAADPNTVMRAFISRISVMLLMFTSQFDTGCYLQALAVCFHYGLGSCLEQLHHQAIGALALKVLPGDLPPFEPRDLRLQCLDLRNLGCVD